MYVYAACACSAFVSLDKSRYPSIIRFFLPPQTSPLFSVCLRIPNFPSSLTISAIPTHFNLLGTFDCCFFIRFRHPSYATSKYAYTHLSTHVLYSRCPMPRLERRLWVRVWARARLVTRTLDGHSIHRFWRLEQTVTQSETHNLRLYSKGQAGRGLKSPNQKPPRGALFSIRLTKTHGKGYLIMETWDISSPNWATKLSEGPFKLQGYF